jgi:hypothetical protein
MVAFVAQDMDHFDNAPALQFLQAGADVGPRHAQGFHDVIGVQGFWGYEEQGMDLRDRAVDAPTGAHFAPMEDELLLNWRQSIHLFLLFQNIQEYRLFVKWKGD